MICVTMKEVSGGWDMQNEKSKSLHFTEEMDRLSTLLNRHAGEVCLEKELKKSNPAQPAFMCCPDRY